MVTFKGGRGKLYYTQYTFLKQCGTITIFSRNTHTNTKEMERDSNTKTYYNSTKKSW